MKVGVVYKFKTHKKLNGTLFYCFEYFRFLRKFVDAKFYIVGISPHDLEFITRIFSEKYSQPVDNIVPLSITELYFVKLDKTLVFDVMTFYDCKEFLTGDIHCYSNDTHGMFRYKNNRTVTYYGSYSFQRYDHFSYLKFNFEIFRPITQKASAVFISANDVEHIKNHRADYERKFDKPIILKQGNSGYGNIFEMVDEIHYVHTGMDKNNRIVPESFFYNTPITFEESHLTPDSVQWRYNDILKNGLEKYTLTEHDLMVQACLN